MKKIILDLCGGTGSWSKPYKDAGYDVRVITLPEADVRKALFSEEWIGFDGQEPIAIKDVHGIIAAPPCTMFSRARTTAKTPRDFEDAMSIVKACLQIVWVCRSRGNLKWWALENPMGLLRQFLGNPAYSFRGWEFGDNHMKFTDLWGYFKYPTRMRGAKAPAKFNRQRWANPKKPAIYADRHLSRADIRAITPPKFAKAFFRANS